MKSVIRVNEKKVVFKDGDDYRVLRGIVIDDDPFFITLKRDDGERKIGKQFIVKIEEVNNG